jgi:hypothetical protein
VRTIVSGLVTLSAVLAILAGPITAEARTSAHTHAGNQLRHQPQSDGEFIAEKRQFGTSGWWRQMDREGRGGRK